jgi:DNA polymerase I-like protein with 3'-5' exonuclease and polymerase domains
MDFFDQLQDLNRPTVTKKSWMEAVTLTLAVTADLDRIADECIASKIFALDIETTGLDARVFTQADGSKTTNDKIVGLCIAPNEKQSYYLPIRHKDDGAAANIPPRMVRDMLLKIQASGAVTIFHNGKFDQEFLEHDPAGAMGCWDEPAKWEDTILLAYLRDAREKRRGLKHLAKTLLEREMIETERHRVAAEREASERAEFERQAKIRAEREAVVRIEADRLAKAERDARIAKDPPELSPLLFLTLVALLARAKYLRLRT